MLQATCVYLHNMNAVILKANYTRVKIKHLTGRILLAPFYERTVPKNSKYNRCHYCTDSNQSNSRERSSFNGRGSWVIALLMCGVSGFWYFSRRAKDENTSTSDELPTKYEMPNTKKLVLYKRKGHWIPYDFIGNDRQLEDVKSFKVRPDDIFVVSFPKSGTTWVQEIVYQIMCIDNAKLDRWKSMDERFPYLEFAYPGIKELEKIKDQRFMKSHVQFEALPQDVIDGKGKVIYVARNAKDVAVSMYHFYKLITNVHYTGSFSEFCEIFNSGKVAYGPYWKHVGDYWQKRESPNVLFITYEALQQDIKSEIKKIAEFIEKPIDDKETETIAQKCRFRYMKYNPATNYNWYKVYGMLDTKGDFMRKGQVGDWKNYYSQAQGEKADEITKMHFKPIGLHIPDSVG